jgi:hypothetical protein
VWRDADRGHAIAAADLVPGNAGDEIVAGGYSGRMVLLVPR